MLQSLRPRLLSILGGIGLLGPLAGCSGFGGFVAHTADPFSRPYVVAGNSTENVAQAHGKVAPTSALLPKAGQPWPTSYPMDPTIMSIEASGSGVP
jgi:hypothetical protein